MSSATNDELRCLAALYLLGQLTPEQGAPFARPAADAAHRQALAEMTEVVASIGMAATPMTPPPTLRLTLMERLGASHLHPGLFAKRRNDQGPWQPTGSAGVAYKTLYLDQSTGLVTRLVRMEPGARNPSHTHGHTEQCLILEGDLRHGEDNVYRAGDFTWGEAGSVDPELYTLEGNLLLIVTEA